MLSEGTRTLLLACMTQTATTPAPTARITVKELISHVSHSVAGWEAAELKRSRVLYMLVKLIYSLDSSQTLLFLVFKIT